MRFKTSVFLLTVALIAYPFAVSAALQISEVMYDVPESDSGREWIEVTNTGTGSVDLSTYKLLEAGVHHKITPAKGSATLAPNEAAVIADNPTKFFTDWPSVSKIFDSAFSLSNEGETLVLTTNDLKLEDQATYTALGASGNGLSLARGSNRAWVSSNPTPGVYDPNPTNVTLTPAEKPVTTKAASSLHTQADSPKPDRPMGKQEVAAVAVASVSTDRPVHRNQSTLWVWVLAAVGLCILGAGSAFALTQANQTSVPEGNATVVSAMQKEADTYEIIE